MAGTITISGLRHIRQLTFDVPGPGVHLLSGSNGAGKTSVLACLRRIGNSTAFAQHFASSHLSSALDNFGGAEITYALNQSAVTYAYAGERWVPRPRAQNKLLQQFGYPEVYYVGATADRITPRSEDFKTSKLRVASQAIRDAANRILGTQKFDGLKIINLTRGVGNSAFVLQASAPPDATYISEKNFSLGELCILKLAKSLQDIANQSLVLIDELELALHPKAQVELLEYLKDIATQKRLTIIFSTHSVSLLKRVDRRQILFLENDNGTVSTIKGCYPTYALGGIAYDEERAPDVVIYVEDDPAAWIVDALVRLSVTHLFGAQRRAHPTVMVVPIGGFLEVVRFVARGRAMLPATTRTSVLLDQDVQQEMIARWTAINNHAKLNEFAQLGDQIAYLPWTPEVGMVAFLSDPNTDAQRLIRERFSDNRITIRQQDVLTPAGQTAAAHRGACKDVVDRVASNVATFLPNHDVDAVKRATFEVFAEWYFATQRAQALQLLGPCIR